MGRRLLCLAFVLTVGGCGWFKSSEAEVAPQATAGERLAKQRRLQRICASTATYDRLKVTLFDKAAQVRGGRADVLDQLQAATIVRMEQPVVKGRDDALGVTVCTGRFVLELPEGAAKAFNGERRLRADIEYTAQPAVDGSGTVYQMQGADPIVYRIAAIGIANRTARAGTELPPAPAAAPLEPVAPDPRAVVSDAPIEVAAPPPPPTRTVVPQRPPVVREVAPQSRSVRARPSFSCANARARVELMVCSSERLAAADRTMSAIFFRAIADTDRETQVELRASRSRFLRFRNACSSEACVAQAYSDRIDEIEDIADGN